MEEFLNCLYGDSVGPERQLVLFTLPEGRPRFFADTTAVPTVARKLAETQNVYFGAGLVAPGVEGRGCRNDVVAIPGVWGDVDLAGAAHPGKPLPQSEDDVQRLLQELPLPLPLIVHSGHGWQPYWLFHEPWLLTIDEQRDQAARLAYGWHELICRTAERLGWAMENLGDLTRLLRLPGTVNRKLADDLREVRIIHCEPDRRYAPDDFEPYLPEDLPLPPDCNHPLPGIAVDLQAEPPASKFQAALLESPLFRLTWERQRGDLLDQSASGYDLSLATLGVLRGWTDSEIASLLWAWRHRHQEHPEKLARADYLNRTLTRARAAAKPEDSDVDLSGFFGSPLCLTDEPPPPEYVDPGPLPEELCRIPGFVSAVMDHCLTTAPYPNIPLAFAGALALQALLAGRKVRDEADNRTNLYLLALAFSAVGKDWPRKVNNTILYRSGLIETLGEKFASGEGLQDALFLQPAMLFQTDEIDGLLQSMNKARDARHENLLGTLLTLYSAANTIYPMRRKAGKEPPGVIDQPNLVVFGTAIPTHFYSALSERMLTNGFFARMLMVESGKRSEGQEPGLIDPPRGVLETARWWAESQPGSGNLECFHPQPRVVRATAEARDSLTTARREAVREHAEAERRGDPVGTTVWGRVQEQTRKLALLYAVSADHASPVIDVAAVDWATQVVMHQTRRMLFMAHCHVAENPFHAECLRLVKKLREAPSQRLPHSVLLKRMKLDTQTFQKLIDTLSQQGDVQPYPVPTNGRTGMHYRLLGERTCGGETNA